VKNQKPLSPFNFQTPLKNQKSKTPLKIKRRKWFLIFHGKGE